MEEKTKAYEMKIPSSIQEDLIKEAVEGYDVEVERTDFGCKLVGEKNELVKVKKFIVDSINTKLEKFEENKTIENEE